MMHKGRSFSIQKLDSFEALAEQFQQDSFVLCCGFQVDDFLFLNDSTGEDGAQEFAVIKDGVQIESLTVSWIKSRADMLAILAELPGDLVIWDAKNIKLDYNPNHSCQYCE